MAEYLHFRDAAAALRMSQPALSAAVAALEENLGTRLVERTTRRVLLTPAGERVAVHAETVLAAMDRLVEEVREVRGPLAGPLRIGVIPTVAPYLLPVLLPRLARDHPRLELTVREQQTDPIMAELLAGRLDVLLLAFPVQTPGVIRIPLYDEDFALVVPAAHPLGGRDLTPLPRAVLRELDVLLLNEGHCLRDQSLDVCREVGGRAVSTTYAASLGTLVQLVSGGLGVTLVPETAVPVEVGRGHELVVRRFAPPAPYRTIGLVARGSSPRTAEFEVLANVLRRAVAEQKWPVRVAGRGVSSGAEPSSRDGGGDIISA